MLSNERPIQQKSESLIDVNVIEKKSPLIHTFLYNPFRGYNTMWPFVS